MSMPSMNASTVPLQAGDAAWLPWRRAVALAVAMTLVSLFAVYFRPTFRLADHKPAIALAGQVPEAFGEWRLDRSIVPVLPDPGTQAMLDSLYSQTLARTYVNATGQRVMLSIAYGSDQGNEATAVHRPEFCYSAQGFRVKLLDKRMLDIASTKVPVARLLAELGQRMEPITYWVTLDETATLPGMGRKLQQINFGLHGQIPDGMLVRVSSISSSLDDAFVVQERFLQQLYAVVPAAVRARYFGAKSV